MRILVALFFLGAALALPARGTDKPLEVVPSVDLERYLGTWYEIAAIPHFFEKGLVGVTATYGLRPDGDIEVINKGHKQTLDGPVKTAKGKAWVVDPKTRAKLKVRFFWPFSGDYWIIELDADYQWVVVGAPDRDYLWILSRTPRLDPSVYQDLLSRATAKGFDVSRLKLTPQKD